MRCDEQLRDKIQSALDAFPARTDFPSGKKRAAVAITVVDRQRDAKVYELPFKASQAADAALVLTRRSNQLRKHAGQWALPGGRMDDGETPEQAALREMEEEVGIRLSPDRVMGCLDIYNTRSGYSICPVVIWGGRDLNMTPNPAEVASIHRIPITEFLRDDAPILFDIPESEHPALMMPVGNNWIAAPTAAMIYQFREVAILGNQKRVAHYEQPHFAWR